MAEFNRRKKWTKEEENTLIDLLKNDKSLNECSYNIGRTISAIKSRIEEIIYKKNINENQSFEELSYLKNYVDISFDEIIKKHKNKHENKNKTNKSDFEKNNNFEEKVLDKLEKIKLKQEEMYMNILKEKNNEINKLKLIVDDLNETKKKNENTITDLLNTISKLNKK